jgi:sugar transferase EpsL
MAEPRTRGLGAKRAFDTCVAGAGLLVLSPVMLLTAVAVAVFLGRPVLFRQVRPGLHGRPFRLLKFRTMTDRRDASGELLPDGDRLTPFGAWLRRASLDELPQLLNVVKGDMSLVGPRPLLMEYLPLYDAVQARRHEVRPGITGWAQVGGRNSLSWGERFALDVWYVEHRSMMLDLRILASTVLKVIRREGISQQGHATAERFRGTPR